MTTKELGQEVETTRAEVQAHLEAISAGETRIATLKAQRPTATPKQVEAIGEEIAKVEAMRPHRAEALDGARERHAAATAAYAAAKGPELKREIDKAVSALVAGFGKEVPAHRSAAQEVVALVVEAEALGVASKPELSSINGVLSLAFNTALTGAGDGLTDCVVVHSLMITSDPPAGIVPGKFYDIHTKLRLPEGTARRLEREGHVAIGAEVGR